MTARTSRSLAVPALVLPFLLAASGVALAVPPTLPSLTYLPGDDVLAPAAGMQQSPEIAAGDGMYLAVWVDDRTAITHIANMSGGPNFDRHIGSMWDVYAARLDLSGNLLDETPIIVAQDIQNQGLPEVAWNGENWLVIWTGQTGLQCCPTENRYAARVSPDGVVLDSPPTTLATDTQANGLWPAAVGSDGTNWLVVWPLGNQAVGRRVGPDGTLLDATNRVLYTGGSPGDFDLVPGIGGGYFLVWSSGGQTSGGTVLGLHLSSGLLPIGGAVVCNLYSPSVGLNCRVATNGSEYFVAWWEDRWFGWSQLAGARVASDGTVLDPSGIQLTDAYGYTNYEPAVGWDGTNWMVAYDKSAFPPIDLFASRVTTDGVVLDYEATAIPVSTAPDRQSQAAIDWAPGAGGALVLWRDARYSGGSEGDIFGATVAPDGTVGTERCVALGTPRQTLLHLVPNDSGHLAVFRSETGLGTRILAQRLDDTDTPIDPEPVEVISGDLQVTSPAAAWNGSVYLVVWENRSTDEILGRRLAADLTPLDPSPVLLMPGNTPDVAALGDVFLTVATYESPPEIRNVYSRRMRGSDGVLLDPSPVTIGFSYSLSPRVAAFADRWIATWERHPTHDNPASSIYATFVDAGGAPSGAFLVDTGGKQPVIAVGETEAMFALVDRNGPTVEDVDILARRMLSDGTFLDGAAFYVSTAVNAQFDPVIAWTGAEYLTAFGDFRQDPQYDSKRGDLYAARVATGGTVIDPTGFPVANDSIPEMFASAAGQAGELLLGGSVFREEPGYVSYRIGLRGTARGATDAAVVATGSPDLRLGIPYPNPFRGTTSVEFELPRAERVRLTVYDATGRRVRTLVDGDRAAGIHRAVWSGTDGTGRRVAAGVYFLRVEAGGLHDSRRVVMIR